MIRSCRAASGHTYLVEGRTLRSLGRVVHRLGRAGRVSGRETIRLHPDGAAASSLLGEGTWSRTEGGARIAFAGADVVLACRPVGESGPAGDPAQG